MSQSIHDFLDQLSTDLMHTQEVLEVVEESAESELEFLRGHRDWAAIDGVPYNTSELEGCEILLEATGEAITDLALIQQRIADRLKITPK